MLYASDIEKTISFYEKYFNLSSIEDKDNKLVCLFDENNREVIRLHKAGKAIKKNQARIKLIFEVLDIEKFIEISRINGLKFGVIHQGKDYKFSNAKDPDGNSVQITTRAVFNCD